MSNEKTTRLLLAAIAAGLWFNVLVNAISPVRAGSDTQRVEIVRWPSEAINVRTSR